MSASARVVKALSAFSKVVRAGLTPSLVSYFFWIGAICCIYGTWVGVTISDISAYLCNIPAQKNASLGYTLGCGNCSDTLMLCDKGACWRYAFNITWQEDANNPDASFYKVFQSAILDGNCNAMVRTSENPVQMLEETITLRAKASARAPGDACLEWSCRVLTKAAMRQLSTDLAGPPSVLYPPEDKCTNAKGVKFPWEADACVCDDLELTLSQATAFEEVCGGMATGLRSATHERIMGRKSLCYQRSVSFAAASFANEFDNTKVDTTCSNLLQRSSSTHDWFRQMLYLNLQVPTYCRKMMCAAMVSSAFNNNNNTCNWTADALQDEPLKRLSNSLPDSLQQITDFCLPEGMPISLDLFCASPGFNSSSPMCRGEEVLGSFSSDDATRGRRLEPTPPADEAASVHMRAVQSVQDAPTQERSAVRPEVKLTHASLQQAVVGFQGLEEKKSDDDGDQSCGGSGRVCEAAIDRRLQAAAATAAANNNDKLQEYTTTPWSKCTCYQQCIDGVRTRTVSCPPGVSCKEPKPTDAVACRCGHCSDCQVLMFIYVTAGGYGFIGLVSFLLWSAFLAISSLEEDDYTDMGMGIKCLGCICRALPAIIKVTTYVNLFCVLILVVTALIPIGDVYSDCKNSPVLRTLAIGGTLVFIFQLALGVYMHRNKPMPPWLHTASSSKAMKILCKPLKCIGP